MYNDIIDHMTWMKLQCSWNLFQDYETSLCLVRGFRPAEKCSTVWLNSVRLKVNDVSFVLAPDWAENSSGPDVKELLPIAACKPHDIFQPSYIPVPHPKRLFFPYDCRRRKFTGRIESITSGKLKRISPRNPLSSMQFSILPRRDPAKYDGKKTI